MRDEAQPPRRFLGITPVTRTIASLLWDQPPVFVKAQRFYANPGALRKLPPSKRSLRVQICLHCRYRYTLFHLFHLFHTTGSSAFVRVVSVPTRAPRPTARSGVRPRWETCRNTTRVQARRSRPLA